MPSRSALAASITVTATLVSGMAAVAATTGFRPLTAASADAASSPQSRAGEPAAGTPSVAPAAWPVIPGTVAGPSTPPTASRAAAAWLVALARGSGAPPTTGAGPSEAAPSAHPTTTTTWPKPDTSPTTKPPTPTTSPAPYNCAGSDDGLSEAVKQAREAYCHSRGFNG